MCQLQLQSVSEAQGRHELPVPTLLLCCVLEQEIIDLLFSTKEMLKTHTEKVIIKKDVLKIIFVYIFDLIYVFLRYIL